MAKPMTKPQWGEHHNGYRTTVHVPSPSRGVTFASEEAGTNLVAIDRCDRCGKWTPTATMVAKIAKRGPAGGMKVLLCRANCPIRQDTKMVYFATVVDKAVRRCLTRMYLASQRRAREAQMPNTFSEDHLEDLWDHQAGRCALTGITLDITAPVSGRKMRHAPSLDRIDSGLGYVEGNLQIVCAIVNIMKSDLPVAVFVSLCCAVAKKNP